MHFQNLEVCSFTCLLSFHPFPAWYVRKFVDLLMSKWLRYKIWMVVVWFLSILVDEIKSLIRVCSIVEFICHLVVRDSILALIHSTPFSSFGIVNLDYHSDNV